MTPAVRVAAIADASQLAVWLAVPASLERATGAVSVAEETEDPVLMARATMAYGMLRGYQPAGCG